MHNEGAITVITAKRLTLALAAAGAIGGAVGAIAVNHNNAVASAPVALAAQTPSAAPSAAPSATPVNPGAPAPLAAGVVLPDFTQIVSRNGPAVVNIRVMGSTKTAMGQQRGRGVPPQFDEDDPFFEFFRRFQGPQMPRGQQRDTPVFGAGSGFIISPDGVILTNAHVVRDAKEVTVKLNDRREFRARVLGSDPKTDVAVLKIDAKNLPVVPIGKSNDLKVGEWVLAIGSPFGLESTVTAGVVSAKGRSLPDDSQVPFIQTDVAVNPGNSGGPLFNTKGEVIGINSQIYSQTGGYMGLSFAIPIDVAYRIKDQIVTTGKVQHAKLGVTIQEVNQGFADSFKLDSPEGALVSNVEKGGAADKAGLKSGDVVRKLNGQPIVASGDLPAMLSVAQPGDKVSLDVWRDGKIVRIDARLANASDTVAQDEREPAAGADQSAKLGLALRPLAPNEKRQSGISAGLVIEDAAGAASTAGVQPGDVLLSVNGRPVNSVEQVRDVVGKASKSVALLIQRGNDRIFIPVRIG
ncbi:DegQ family serine endoprotease [Massilia genomosp. 1]|uniref:Probable periplasmic serine endoprotease DegP-like n=1 Tax=Massilia genomosp. 1 TaxID=2609280 RepID=A0ABX0MD38_9BURK|nr:DegQ family serine endoprotease [Massilia genomosp. 1]NHZ60734.1 Do family serine endopeptidase [Massilia genomosp. 1]